jgi:multiple sugar transport system ATP-binding protein
MASLTIRNLRKSFGAVEVLKGIDLEATTGEFIALVGPSGCGKSTLLAMIAGLETITSGEIYIGDRLVNSVAPKDRDIAMVFQSYALYPTMTVRENMAFGMESRGIPKDQQKAAIERVAALLKLDQLLHRKPGQLSGGQRQRVAMGRALVRDPALFLFDEPLSNLDAKLRVDMRTEMKKLHQRVGKTTVYVTHDQVEAMTLASRIAVMHLGEVQQFAEPETVYNRPANVFVAGFMGSPSMNFINAEFTDAGGKPAVTVAVGGGTSSLPLHNGAADRARGAGRNVILGVRPEHLSRYNADVHGSRPGIASFSAPVEVVEPTGAETIAILRVGDKEVVGRFSPDEAPKMGEEMKLAVDMTRACLFDPTTQKLI